MKNSILYSTANNTLITVHRVQTTGVASAVDSTLTSFCWHCAVCLEMKDLSSQKNTSCSTLLGKDVLRRLLIMTARAENVFSAWQFVDKNP